MVLRERAAVAVVLLLVVFYISCILIGQSQLFEGSNKFIRGSNTDPLFAVFKNLFDPRINKSFIIRHSVSHRQRGKPKKSSALSALYAQKLERVPLNIYVFSLSKCLHQNLLRDSLHWTLQKSAHQCRDCRDWHFFPSPGSGIFHNDHKTFIATGIFDTSGIHLNLGFFPFSLFHYSAALYQPPNTAPSCSPS
jgi:hypothetical protein